MTRHKFYAHPTAVVESEDIGEGTRIWHFAHVRERARIGKNCIIGKSSYIDTEVILGNNVKIQNFVSVYKGVIVEDNVFIGPSVTFTNDEYPRAYSWSDEQIIPTTVRRGASIGAGSVIICGNEIGEYSMIGAGSVVTRDVHPNTLVYGNPARYRGVVCKCGRKLTEVESENEHAIHYTCECGETIEVLKEWIR
ncbi:MAG: acyltransferase [Archaeoglobaceae archaeon]